MGFKIKAPKIKVPTNVKDYVKAVANVATFGQGDAIVDGVEKIGNDISGALKGAVPKAAKVDTAGTVTSQGKLSEAAVAGATQLGSAADAAKAMAEQRQANPTKTGTVQSQNAAVSTAAPAQAVNTDLSNVHQTVDDGAGQVGELERMRAARVGNVQQATNQAIAPLERVGAAQISTDPQEQLRQQQLALAQRLEAQSRGEGPSVAGSQLQTATDRAIKQQFAMAAASGMDPAMAQRAALENTANISQEAGRASAELRTQEQLNAQNALANVAGSARQQDIGLATDQAKLQMQTDVENAAAQNNKLVAEAKMRQDVELTNKSNALAAQLKQAELKQDANQINKIQQDMAQLEQAKMDLNKAQFNAEAFNRAAEWSKKLSSQEQQFNATVKSQLDMFNSGQINASNQADAARKLQADVANQEAVLKAKGMDDAAIAASMGMSLDALKAVTSTNLTAASGQLQADIEMMKAKLAAATGAQQAQTQMIGGLMSAGGAVGAAAVTSDKRAKKNIKDGGKSIEDFLEALNSYEFEYKDGKAPGAAEGQRYGIMIQDIEKTPVGAALVIEDDGVKKMDVGQGLGTALAAIGTLNKKVDKIASFADALARGEESTKPTKSEEKDVGLAEILSAMKNKKKKTGRFA